jgi:UTP--glucose-1-phosphate uridylyltransferase
MNKVRKAVIPVAGLGTRILPAAKATPKNLLNVFDRPLLAYIVAEAWAAGIEHLVFVLGRGQSAIEDYFDHAFELETTLESKGKGELLRVIRADLPRPGQLSFVRQMAPLGLGHAVWCARDIVGAEPFAVMLPDMLMEAEPTALAQAISAFGSVSGNVVLVEQAPAGEAHKYGIVALGEPAADFGGKLRVMTGMVEKPQPGTEPSNLLISGRYVLQPEIFELLSEHRPGAGGEIQLTDAMAALSTRQSFHALEYDRTTFDCGDPVGLLRASLAMALKHPELGQRARSAAKAIFEG